MHFANTIETRHGRLNFYYNKIYTANGERFHISFVEKNKTSSLLMKENEQIWSIINRENCPDWIIELEPKFRTIIALHSAGIE